MAGRKKLTVKRKGYWRKAHTRKNGTRVKRTWVPPTTYKIKDRGKKGRAPKYGWIRREGKLGGPGYLSKSATARHRLLNKSVKKYGYRSTLGSIMALNRSTTITQAQRFKLNADKNYLHKKFGGKGSFTKRKSRRKKR